jgi:hypothetical protein
MRPNSSRQQWAGQFQARNGPTLAENSGSSVAPILWTEPAQCASEQLRKSGASADLANTITKGVIISALSTAITVVIIAVIRWINFVSFFLKFLYL